MDAVADRLFVGTTDDAENTIQLRDRSVDAVVSLTRDNPCVPKVSVTRIPMVDGPQNDIQTFERAVIESNNSRLTSSDNNATYNRISTTSGLLVSNSSRLYCVLSSRNNVSTSHRHR